MFRREAYGLGCMTPLEFVQQARWLADRRGYKSSWVYVVYREKYGEWPGKLLKEGESTFPSDEFLDWLGELWNMEEPRKLVALWKKTGK